MSNKRIKMISGLLCCLFLITACSGGGGGSSSSGSTPAVTPKPNISLNQATYNFAGIVLDNNADKTFTITNTGNANLIIGTITSPAVPFSISSNTCTAGLTLTPYQTCSLVVRFSPTTQDSFAGTFSIPSNDPDSATVNVTLQGAGYGLNVWINQVNTASCPTTINVDVTVTDPSNPGLLLDSLIADDFTVTQNGVAQSINLSPIVDPSPVSVVMALDLSSSLADVTALKTAAKDFIDLLRDGVDEAAICKFKFDIDFYPVDPTFFIQTNPAGKLELQTYIDNADTLADGTRLYNAIYDSIDRAAEGTTDKKAVIVLSDGDARYSSGKTIEQVTARAIEKGIPIFTIFFDPADVVYANTEVMQKLAKDTGGQYYNSDDMTLTTIFQQVATVLGNKYTIDYTPTSCSPGSTITLEVQATYSGLNGLDTRTILP